MKAIRVKQPGGPEVLQLEDVPDPAPGPGEVVVRVAAVGVNFIEIYQRSGQYPMKVPFTPGAEAAGNGRRGWVRCDACEGRRPCGVGDFFRFPSCSRVVLELR